MGEVVDFPLGTKKQESYFDLCNPRLEPEKEWAKMYNEIRMDWERELDESHKWYNKYARLHLDVSIMSLWDRIFNWPYQENKMECKNCKSTGWVCEAHPQVSWEYDECCGAAGMPCIWCNPCDKDNPPRMKEGYEIPIEVGLMH